jgi:hypothetical protein
MRVKRAKPKLTRVQRDAVLLFCKLRALQATGMHAIKEAQGGKADEFHEGSVQLCKLMGLKNFWQEDPMMCDHPDPADYIKHNGWRYAGWRRGWAARCQLEKLTATL